MLRNFVLAAAAAAALGFVALAPTAASAQRHGWGHHHRGHGWGHHHNRHAWGHFHRRHIWGPRLAFGGPGYFVGNPCVRTRWVPTPWGPQLRRVNVCF